MPEALTGWGRTAPTVAELVRVPDAAAACRVLANPPPRGVLARGLGRSYGDAAQNAGGIVIATDALDDLAWVDEGAGLLRVGAGTSLGDIIRAVVPQGWWIPVSPGTAAVTVGGAIGADVHGKNHHADGSFCRYVTALTLATPTGVREVTPESDPELFWATAGGLGLTGIVLAATLRLVPVETSRLRVTTTRAAGLDEAMALLAAGDASHRYSVAWVDALARGRHLGRAVVSTADHARLRELPPAQQERPLALPRGRGAGPAVAPPGLLSRVTMRAFNALWYQKAGWSMPGSAGAGEPVLQTLAQFFHPLDAVGGWNRLYGPRGLVQYQFVVPFGAEAVVAAALERMAAAGVGSFLVVLKRFGPGDPGPMSFPMPGWTLALDAPARLDGLASCLDALDLLVAEAGGRVYLVKDARLRPDMLAAMYPGLEAWNAVRRRVDPEGVLRSDLGRRLGLVRAGAGAAA